MLGDLSAKYESNGDCGCISDGYNDAGGKSYGAYQFSSVAGTLADFVNWLSNVNTDFYNTLASCGLSGEDFDAAWIQLASNYPDEFLQVQHEYIKEKYYDVSMAKLANAGFRVENHAAVMQDVIWSRAVQYGVGNIVDMFTEACSKMYNSGEGEYTGYPNLSYIDDAQFDYDLIYAVYILVCGSQEWNNGPSKDSLNNRFASECHDALAKL
jgi:hypothetical protein